MLDIVQRYRDVLFYSGDVADEWDMLDILDKLGITYIIQNTLLQQDAKDLSVYIKINIEGTGAIVDAAITAGDHGLIYMSSVSIVFNDTNIENGNKQVPGPKKPFNTYNEAQEVFRPRGSQISNNNNLFDYTYIGNVLCASLLAGGGLVPRPSYSSTMLSELRLDPESMAAALDEFLHCALSPICATTECHCMIHSSMWTLNPYVTSASNAESILSVFNTPFNSHELECLTVCSRVEGWALFIMNREWVHFWDAAGLYNEQEGTRV
ncbi:hypothetical protein M404DRAFT_151519 [Pisolithus tinctorius Marx 270]|uniref:3-beta hydroxysteroid dehydrogenase/isomerase domain-containing protein n=1 Tax=Pisolithus tinctorius Marx 270 TaxID=870435 RepID=A0A0C3NIX5_PISTI|nr:hypothetical protein M404DRAFT_151519 [Pisolithus tinctorius Marx 270]